jgi:uncharacterized protein (TIGR00730 family)
MTEKYIENTPEKYLPIETITRRDVHNYNQQRIDLITEEFTNGFNFIKNYPKSVTFFGSSRLKEGNIYYEKARSLSARIVKDLKYSVFTGGGPGLMEAASRGAFEAGGKSLGLTIKLPTEQITNNYLTDHIGLHYFFSRKVCLSFSAEAFIFMPGGFGTLDEFFEILTLVQTHKIEKTPLILFGADFWKNIDELIKQKLLPLGVIDGDDISLYTVSDDENEIIDIIRQAPVRYNIKFDYKQN